MHYDTLILLIQISGLLLFARLLGEAAQRLGQPAVVGEILAGILLGPSILGNIPLFAEHIVPSATKTNYLDVISLIGAMFLLFIAGMETDIKLIRHHSKKALWIAGSSFLIAFVSVFLFSLIIPERLLVENGNIYVFAFFIALTISVSAISVIAKVLIDLNLIRRDFGQVTIAVGMIDETIIWVLLSVLIGLVSNSLSNFGSVSISFVKVLIFIIVGFLVGKYTIRLTINFIKNKIKTRDKFLTLVVVIIFIYGAVAQAIGLEAVLGSFVAGIIFGQVPYLSDETIEKLESFTFAIFAPVFFAAAGLKVNLMEFTDSYILLISFGLILVSFIGKGAGAYLGARFFAKSDHWTAVGYGFTLNTRGTIQIIVATIGLTLGLISQDIFSIIIVISILTSLISPMLLKSVLKRVEPNKDELERIKKEEIYASSLVSKIHRILLPVRVRSDMGPESIKLIETKILERLGSKENAGITLLTISSEQEKLSAQKFLDNVADKFQIKDITKKVVVGSDSLGIILDEAKKDYDLLIIGATQKQSQGDTVFNTFLDNLIRLSPCPSIIVQSKTPALDWQPSRILVPTDGSRASKRAAEVAFSIANQTDDEVHILRVIEDKREYEALDVWDSVIDRQFSYANDIANELKAIGESFSVNTFTNIELGINPETVILDIARENKFDLVVLGVDIRPGSERLYLGPRVEKILEGCVCPVIVVNSF